MAMTKIKILTFLAVVFLLSASSAFGAITYTYSELPKPTGETATLAAGGSLDIGVTYYYKIFHIAYSGSYKIASMHTAEVSATTDAANRSITISWTNATPPTGWTLGGTVIMRTTTSGSYVSAYPGQFNCLGYNTGCPIAFSGTSHTDDGTDPICKYWDRPGGEPHTKVTIGSGDVFYVEDLWKEDQDNGWGAITKLGNSIFNWVYQDGYSGIQYGGHTYVINGHLEVSNSGTWRMEATNLEIFGQPYWSGSGSYEFGDSAYSDHTRGCNITVHDNYYIWSEVANGAKNSQGTIGGVHKWYFSSIRNIKTSSYIQGFSGIGWLTFNTSDGSVFEKCKFGYQVANGLPWSGYAITRDCHFYSLRVSTNNLQLINPVISGSSEGLSLRWSTNMYVTGAKIRGSGCDITWGHTKGSFVVNPTFEAKIGYSTQSNPYYKIAGNSVNYLKHSLCIAYSLDLKVVDNNGNAISGATVTIKDKNGYGAIWVDAETTGTDGQIDTGDTIFGVSDGTKFDVGDEIRIKNNAEVMKVTAINGNNLTVTRGVNGTVALNCSSWVTTILKRVDSLTTDENGEVSQQILIERQLTIERSDAGYFDNRTETQAIDQGYAERLFLSPYTVTITKAGYGTRTIKYTMDRKREEIEMLTGDGEAGGTVFYDSTIYDSTIY